MSTRSRSVSETAEWPAASPHAGALVSPRVVARAVRRLEDALSALDLTGRVSVRARGVVAPVERAD
jgi:hypothetical protein